jgi:hypothetical protein
MKTGHVLRTGPMRSVLFFSSWIGRTPPLAYWLNIFQVVQFFQLINNFLNPIDNEKSSQKSKLHQQLCHPFFGLEEV